MARMHQGESWLAAFDKATGEMAWKVPRNYKTPVECDHGYSTPLVIQHQGKESILVWGAEHLTIHNATDGQLTWSCGNFNPDGNKLWPAIATPVLVGDMAIIAYGRNDLPIWVHQTFGWILQTILRPVGVKGFVVLPKRWIVERTFAWLTRHRRHSKDYEKTTASSEALTYIAMIGLMSKRLAKL